MGRARLSAVFGVGVLYFALAAVAIWLVNDHNEVPPIWPANAVLLALLLQPKRTVWIDVLIAAVIGNVLANVIASDAFIAPAFYGMVDVIEVTIAAYALRRAIGGGGVLGDPENLGKFILWAGGVAPAIGGFGGAVIGWYWLGQDFATGLRKCYFSDALGLLVFTPFFTSLLAGDYRRAIMGRKLSKYLEAAAIILLVTVTSIVIFGVAHRPAAFVLFAPLMLATFRLGRLGTQFAMLIVAIAGAVGAFRLNAAFSIYGEQPELRLHLMQFFLAVVLLTCLPVAASLSARARLTEQLAESERRLRARERDLVLLAATDSLTGLLNRGALNERIDTIHREGQIAVAVLDLDRFKEVNDRFGHDVGDLALVHFARVIEAGVRQGDVVARVGGDEFMIFFPGTGQSDAGTVCDRLAAALRETPMPIGGDDTPYTLGMSCGVAERRDGETIEAVIKRADQALYAAKAAGRSRVLRAA
ncbi:sensor domain-containing diguanylate cyclase [uncultured Sphingomonas sp.]|uniref:GGDEF domain-containing protein n=1 Tax=uncultured Sphingomonas sp. TaxID=158754 RepID=UPI002604476D|nr:sensor domain-containing diguanylate cyclase [uncultured Sphingomonas sp.]